MATVLFYLGFSTLITHEMDAIIHKEWRLLYFLRTLPENVASTLFIGVHVPFLALLMGLAHHEFNSVQQGTRGAISLFLIFHGSIHKRLDHHPQYTFHSNFSTSLIYGGSSLGLLYFIALYWR